MDGTGSKTGSYDHFRGFSLGSPQPGVARFTAQLAGPRQLLVLA